MTLAVTTNTPSNKSTSFWGGMGTKLSRLGKALMFPIAMLPVAAILLRIGSAMPTVAQGGTSYSDFIGTFLSLAGSAVFNNLSILFAIGLAFGLSKDSRGEAAIVGFVCMMFLISVMNSSGLDLVKKFYGSLNLGNNTPGHSGFDSIFNSYDSTGKLIKSAYDAILATNVLNGIVIGSLVAWLYNNFKSAELPQVLGFFSGRRLVPIVSMLATMIFVLLWALIFPWLGYIIFELSNGLGDAQGNRWANAGIMFAYGILNRLLIPFGLHNIPNTLFWFTFGSLQGADGKIYYGDINIFLNGKAEGNHAGTFQSGFFPIMMFGLPALVAAIYTCAEKSERAKVLGLLGGAAFISFFTGITEPIEFAFLYAAPLLFGIHALLTGVFGFITGLFGIQLGFGFSAGFIDYVLSIPKSMQIINANKYSGIDAIMRNPAWLIVIGAFCAATYYTVARYTIRRFNWSTPGRKNNLLVSDIQSSHLTSEIKMATTNTNPYLGSSQFLVQGLGGVENIEQIEWCATRLRSILKKPELVSQRLLKMGGSQGNIKVGANGLQIIMGPKVEQYGDLINSIISGEIPYQPVSEIRPTSEIRQTFEMKSTKTISLGREGVKVCSPLDGEIVKMENVNDPAFSSLALGPGVAIKPKYGKVYAPFDGKIATVFPTLHAYGIEEEATRLGILIHIGLDTINAKAKGFKSYVKQDQKVKMGDLIAEFDIDQLKSKNYDMTTPIVVLKDGNERNVKILTKTKNISHGEPLFLVK